MSVQQIENTSVLDNAQSGVMDGVNKFFSYTGFRNATPGNIIMILVGLVFIFLAIKYDYEPLLLIPIGTGVIIGNIPFFQDGGINLQLGIYQEGSVLNYLYFGVVKGIYPPLIFLGIGAMTDFSSLISNPRLMLLGAAAQVGIFLTFIGALYLGFNMPEAGAIGIIGGADGPTAIFLVFKAGQRRYYQRTANQKPDRTYRDCSLFVYGPGAGDPTTHHAFVNLQKGTCNPHETTSFGK